MKYCSASAADCGTVLILTKNYWTLAYEMSAIPGWLGGALLAYLVIAGKTIIRVGPLLLTPPCSFCFQRALFICPRPLVPL
jgi:hypothetical protein